MKPLFVLVFLLMTFGCESADTKRNHNQAPHAAENPLPSNGAMNISRNPKLSWNASDPDQDSLFFEVFFGTDTSNLLLYATTEEREYDHTDTLLYSSIYFWRINTSDQDSLTTTGPVWSFATVPSPLLNVSVDTLDFDSTNITKSFQITNGGGEQFNWNVVDDQAWLNVSPNSGITSNESDQVTVTVDPTNLSLGDHFGTITITSSLGTVKTFGIHIKIVKPNLTFNTSQTTITYNQQTHSVTYNAVITNTGLTPIQTFLNFPFSTNSDLSSPVNGAQSGYITIPARGSITYPFLITIGFPGSFLLPDGTYYVGIVVDGLNIIIESNDLDNVYIKPTPISYP